MTVREADKVGRPMEALKILLLSSGAAVFYGVLHDQITARVCIEYFTVAHQPIFGTNDPTILGFGWGVFATWWVGLLLGLPLAVVALFAKQVPLTAGQLLKPLVVLLVCLALAALAAGFLGYYGARTGAVKLGSYNDFQGIPREKYPAFIADLWAHWTSYNLGVCGAIVLWAWILAPRLRLRFGLSERAVWCPLGAALAPFVLVSFAIVIAVVYQFHGLYWRWGEVAIFFGSLAVGAAFVCSLPTRIWIRILLAIIYLPVMCVALAAHGFVFSCQVSGMWP